LRQRKTLRRRKKEGGGGRGGEAKSRSEKGNPFHGRGYGYWETNILLGKGKRERRKKKDSNFTLWSSLLLFPGELQGLIFWNGKDSGGGESLSRSLSQATEKGGGGGIERWNGEFIVGREEGEGGGFFVDKETRLTLPPDGKVKGSFHFSTGRNDARGGKNQICDAGKGGRGVGTGRGTASSLQRGRICARGEWRETY